MDPLLNQSFSLQVHNPLGGSMNFDPLVYGLTQQDIKDSASPTLKTSFTGGNISMTDVIMQDIQDLSKRKYSTIVLPDGMEDRESGLYLNNERMGYWNKPSNTWTAYIDNQGNFQLTHPTNFDSSLIWNSALGTLTVRGDINGSIITGSQFQTDSGLSRIEISDAEIRGYADNGSSQSKHFATIMPSAFVGSYRGVSISPGADGGGDLTIGHDLHVLGTIECEGSMDIDNGQLDIVNNNTGDGITVNCSTGHGGRFSSSSSNINDVDVYCQTDIAVGVGAGSNARIYLGNMQSYIWSNGGQLTWHFFGTNYPIVP